MSAAASASTRGALRLAAFQSVAPHRAALTLRSIHASAVAKGGMTPPLPAFKRNPLKQSSLIENYDALWDDGVAPELALDFDMPSVSSSEAVMTWMAAFGVFFGLYLGIRVVTSPEDNPAMSHATDCVVKDWSNLQATPLESN